jgi:hypothetical protein
MSAAAGILAGEIECEDPESGLISSNPQTRVAPRPRARLPATMPRASPVPEKRADLRGRASVTDA